MNTEDREELAQAVKTYEWLRKECYKAARKHGLVAPWLRNVINEYDFFLGIEDDGVHVSGSSYSSATCGPEDYEFVVPFEMLEA